MSFVIAGYNKEHEDAIKEVLTDLWNIDEFCPRDVTSYDIDMADNDCALEVGQPLMECDGDSSLCGGESEEEFADRISEAIWEANGGAYCMVHVMATYLENLPCDNHHRGRTKYDEWKAAHAVKDAV